MEIRCKLILFYDGFQNSTYKLMKDTILLVFHDMEKYLYLYSTKNIFQK